MMNERLKIDDLRLMINDLRWKRGFGVELETWNLEFTKCRIMNKQYRISNEGERRPEDGHNLTAYGVPVSVKLPQCAVGNHATRNPKL
jgi:hypothetical protein